MDNRNQYDESYQPEDTAKQAAELIRGQINSIHGASPQPNDRPDPSTNRAAYEQWYYGLSQQQQQAEWDKYYSQNEAPNTAHVEPQHAVSQTYAHEHVTPEPITPVQPTTLTADPTPSERARQRMKLKKRSSLLPFRSLITAVFIALIFTFAFYNEIVVGQVRSYISPASTVSTPVILDPSLDIEVGPESRIIIPKINVDVPVVYDVDSLEESAIQEGLNDGVVDYNYPGTVDPGQIGNNVIVGHSSNNFLNSGKYKFAFVLLERLEEGDTFILHHEGVRYIYRITNREVIEPTDFSKINEPSDKAITTLITCTPPGTSWKRFIIQGEQISPAQATAETVSVPAAETSVEAPIPGNAPSFWSQLFN